MNSLLKNYKEFILVQGRGIGLNLKGKEFGFEIVDVQVQMSTRFEISNSKCQADFKYPT